MLLGSTHPIHRVKILRNPQTKMASFLAATGCHLRIPLLIMSSKNEDQLQYRSLSLVQTEGTVSRRGLVLGCGVNPLVSFLTLNWFASPLPALSETESNRQEEKEEEDGMIGAIKSLLDPNEKTKQGSLLPKAYLKSAKEVVKTLRESLKEDPKDMAKFRRNADAAKESIRDYLNNWRGQKTVVSEKSYVMLEKAIRSLANFYSRSGPSAELPEEVRQEILDDLSTAEEFL